MMANPVAQLGASPYVGVFDVAWVARTDARKYQVVTNSTSTAAYVQGSFDLTSSYR